MPTATGDVRRGQGICNTCAGHDSAAAEAAFCAILAERAAELLESYVNSKTAVLVRCAAGHVTRPWPGYVLAGGGVCHVCAGKEWDAFYVVTSEAGVKFGITSGDARMRLAQHRTAGYRTVIRLLNGLPEGVAPQMEDRGGLGDRRHHRPGLPRRIDECDNQGHREQREPQARAALRADNRHESRHGFATVRA